jgi:dTMP kinase
MVMGALVVFEGIDGCGKSTQFRLLEAALRTTGIDVLCTRQPTSWYRENPKVRAYLDHGHAQVSMDALCLLAAEDRRRHLTEVVLPSLARGYWVLCDRYTYSSYAYFRARGIELSFVRQANEGVRRPDMTAFLDISPEDARQRVLGREGTITKFEEKSLRFMSVVRDTFFECRDESFDLMDARQSPEMLHKAIVANVERRLGVRLIVP